MTEKVVFSKESADEKFEIVREEEGAMKDTVVHMLEETIRFSKECGDPNLFVFCADLSQGSRVGATVMTNFQSSHLVPLVIDALSRIVKSIEEATTPPGTTLN